MTIMVGEEEVKQQIVQIKNQDTGKQTTFPVSELIKDFAGIYRQLTVDTSVIDKYFRGEE